MLRPNWFITRRTDGRAHEKILVGYFLFEKFSQQNIKYPQGGTLNFS